LTQSVKGDKEAEQERQRKLTTSERRDLRSQLTQSVKGDKEAEQERQRKLTTSERRDLRSQLTQSVKGDKEAEENRTDMERKQRRQNRIDARNLRDKLINDALNSQENIIDSLKTQTKNLDVNIEKIADKLKEFNEFAKKNKLNPSERKLAIGYLLARDSLLMYTGGAILGGSVKAATALKYGNTAAKTATALKYAYTVNNIIDKGAKAATIIDNIVKEDTDSDEPSQYEKISKITSRIKDTVDQSASNIINTGIKIINKEAGININEIENPNLGDTLSFTKKIITDLTSKKGGEFSQREFKDEELASIIQNVFKSSTFVNEEGSGILHKISQTEKKYGGYNPYLQAGKFFFSNKGLKDKIEAGIASTMGDGFASLMSYFGNEATSNNS
jgi:hypothetical protein